jgi:hypothetical protein
MAHLGLAGAIGKSLLAPRSLVINLLVVSAFGILVPWHRGLDLFDPFVIFAYSAIGLLFAASAVTALIALEEPRVSATRAMLWASIYGLAAQALIYALGIAAVNLAYSAPRFLHPNWRLLGAVLVFTFAGGLFLAGFAATLAVLFSASVSRTAVRAIFALLLLGVLYGRHFLPPLWQAAIDRQMTTAGLTRIALVGAAASAVLAAGLLFAHRQPAVLSRQVK